MPPPVARRSRPRWVVAATLGVAVAIVAVIIVAVTVGQRGGSGPKESTSGARTGSTGAAGGTVASGGTSLGFKVTPYAADFPVGDREGGVGPTGVAFDQAGDLFVADVFDRNVYEVPSGGSAGPGRTINSVPYPATLAPFGLAWSSAGHLYADYFGDTSGSIVEVNPRDGQILRTVVSLHTLAGGMAVDPASGDLLVSAPSQSRVYRVGGLGSSSPSTSVYVSGAKDVFDGIAVEPDRSGSAPPSAGAGTLWAVDNHAGILYGFAGTGAADSGQEIFAYTLRQHRAGTSPQPSGVVALAAQGQQQRLLVNENDGTIVMLSWTWGSASPTVTETDVATGGTRGDFATADSGGCAYATQSSAVEKVTLTDGNCDYYAGGHQ